MKKGASQIQSIEYISKEKDLFDILLDEESASPILTLNPNKEN